MATMDIFNSDAFSTTSMTAALDKLGYVPGFLRNMSGLYVPAPVRTEDIFIEERENAPALIQTSERGEAPKNRVGEKRKVRGFKTVRVAQKSRIKASELQGIRAFGSESELMAVQVEVARRQVLMRRDFELTFENMFLGMVQGLAVDADATTIYDWATEFGQTIPAEIDFDLDNASPASGAVRKKCNQVTRSILRGLQGLGGNMVSVVALCGDNFWDDLTAHSEVRQTYLNTVAAAELREGNAFETFRYGGITWTNYRGTDDGTTVAVGTDKAKFFPVGAGIFQWALSPGESFDFINTLGRETYTQIVLDKDRMWWADVEMYSYPLPVCTMPQALHQGRRT